MTDQPGAGPKASVDGVHQSSEHPIYAELHESEEFAQLRSKYRSFAIPFTVAFLAWYLLYVVMSNWANDFMSTKIVGNINIALVFGLLQFASTFVIAGLYARHMNRHVDPLARSLTERYDAEMRRDVATNPDSDTDRRATS